MILKQLHLRHNRSLYCFFSFAIIHQASLLSACCVPGTVVDAGKAALFKMTEPLALTAWGF